MAATNPTQADRKAAAAEPERLSALRLEHGCFKALLDIAREQQRHLAGDLVDFDLLQDVLHYLTDYPDKSHRPCEDRLSDLVAAKAGPTKRDTLESLREQHGLLQAEGNRLYFGVMRAHNGEDISRQQLRSDLSSFLDLYETHMREEETHLFDLALAVLADCDWESLSATMQPVDDPLFGTRVRRRYRRLANVLQERIGAARRPRSMLGDLSVDAIVDKLSTASEAAAGLGIVASDHALQTLRENVHATRESVAAGNVGALLGLPARLNRNTLRHLVDGLGECRRLVVRATEDIRTPYHLRIDSLKKSLRAAWEDN